jgi:hypothetical protein
MCPNCGSGIDLAAKDLGPGFTIVQCRHCRDSWRWSDAGADAFGLVLARSVGSMAPVEDQCLLDQRPRTARFKLCLVVWYRLDGDHEWRRGTTVNVSRSGVLFHASGGGRFSPRQPTDSNRPVELVIEVTRGAMLSQIHCLGTIARVEHPSPGEDTATIAATIGDYILLAN